MRPKIRWIAKTALPVALGVVFWVVVGAYWLFLFRSPEDYSGGFLELGLLVIAGLVPVYIGTVVGLIMSIYLLRATQGKSRIIGDSHLFSYDCPSGLWSPRLDP